MFIFTLGWHQCKDEHKGLKTSFARNPPEKEREINKRGKAEEEKGKWGGGGGGGVRTKGHGRHGEQQKGKNRGYSH